MSSVEFNALLIGNADFLKPFAFNLTQDDEYAKDLYQETLLKALSNQEKYQEGTNIRAWLFTIMRNIFINSYRKKIKHPTLSESDAHNLLYTQQTNLGGDIFIKDVHLALYQLTPSLRTPLLLFYEGYKYHEIADLLQEPIGTIKSRIHFARKMLRSQFLK